MTKEEKIQQQIYEIESQYPNLHIDLHRDQFKSGDVDKLHLLYNQLEIERETNANRQAHNQSDWYKVRS
mgnify:CR=1 FL=1